MVQWATFRNHCERVLGKIQPFNLLVIDLFPFSTPLGNIERTYCMYDDNDLLHSLLEHVWHLVHGVPFVKGFVKSESVRPAA